MRPARDAETRLPFLNGVYVAVAAIPRAFVLVDGPYCVPAKAQLHLAHDLASDLLRPFGLSRVLPTGVSSTTEEVAGLATDRASAVRAVLREVCAASEPELVLCSTFDFHELAGFPFERVARAVAAETGRLVCHVPSRSLGGDWLDGYADTLAALARELPLAPAPRARAVAVVGHLMDRGEGDQRGNVAELERLLALLDLEPVSLWLSGRGVEHLRAAERASLIVSLPYAREAARLLGERLAVPVVEAPLPVGLSATAELLRQVAGAADRAAEAEAIVERESRAAVRAVQPLVDRTLLGRTVLLRFPDPHLRGAVARLCADLGALGRDFEDVPGLRAAADDRPPAPAGLEGAVVLAATLASWGPPLPHVAFGYPNALHHPVAAEPFLGFAGVPVLAARLAEAALRAEAGGAWR